MGISLFSGATVSILVANLERSVRFYGRVLGLRLRSRSESSAEMEIDGLVLSLRQSDRPTVRESHAVNPSIGFQVEGLDGAMLVLRERGVDFSPEIAEDHAMRVAWFADPDGTPLHVWEKRAQPAAVAGSASASAQASL